MIDRPLPQSPTQLFATIGSILVLALFLTNWPNYQYQVLDGLIPLYYYGLSILFVVPFFMLRPQIFSDLLRQPILLWFVLYIMSGLVWVLFATQNISEVNQIWESRFLVSIFFCAGLVLTALAAQQRVAWAIAGSMVFAAITYWLDFLFPFQFVPLFIEGSNPGRGAGLFINANQAAYALVLMCIAAMPFVVVRLRFMVLIVMLVGVVPTFSRGAIILAVVVAVMWAYFGQLTLRQLLVICLLAPLVVFGAASLFQMGLDADGTNLTNLTGRLEFFSSGGKEAYDASAEERRQVAELAWQMFANNPILGDGVGSTTTWAARGSTHNMYLLFLAEQGIVGGILYLSLLGLILVRGARLLKSGLGRQDRDVGVALFLLGVYFVFVSFFSHTLLTEPATLFLLAFLLTAEIKATRMVDTTPPLRGHV